MIVNSDEESDSDAYQDVPELSDAPEDTTQARLRGTLDESDSDEESDSMNSSEEGSEAEKEKEKENSSKELSQDEDDEKAAKKGSSKKGKAEQSSPFNKDDEDIIEEGRLFLQNIPYSCKEEELRDFVSQYGEIVDVFIPLNSKRESKGYAFVTFMFPEQAIAAIEVDVCLKDSL